ncbi:inverted formin-2-like [Polistes fuscatus]|uniref:inverted formin-2-like n=1 Tax=Polistes fuscatus TaxID=30207 RepID=UPI001CA966E7|nr:inverted formin-2-like [Polistes fuscatus]
MHLRLCKIIIILLCIFSEFNINKKQRFPTSRAFLIFKTNSISGRSCTCPTSYSCSCCENVIIIYTKVTKQLCVNFSYETNGLNVNITLNTIVLTNQTVTEYKPFKICSKVPGSLFSSVCANILELNRFPRSITACLRTDITTKYKLWELTYNCVSISTELPMMTSTQSSQMPAGQMPAMPAMPAMTPGQMPAMPAMTPGQMPAMPAMTPGQMPGMPAMTPEQMPAMPAMPAMTTGQMPGMPGMSGMTTGQMPGMPGMSGMTPGQMPGMSGMTPEQMPGMSEMTPGQMMGMPPG